MIYICYNGDNGMITYCRFFSGTIRFLIYITYKLESAELSINSFYYKYKPIDEDIILTSLPINFNYFHKIIIDKLCSI